MKNYSFSNIANEDTYTRNSNQHIPSRNEYPLRNDHSVRGEYPNRHEYPTRAQYPYRHSELSSSEASQRIEDIKKKYDTPSRRERIDSLKKSKDFELGKENYNQHRPAPSFGNNCLRESFAVNRLEKSSLRGDINAKEVVGLRREEALYRLGAREEQQALFSKVREMKQSLINNDYMKSSGNGRGNLGKVVEGRRDFDPRVENIDKINSKIKQILSCLTENQKAPSKYIREDRESTGSFLRERESLGSFANEKGNVSFGFRSEDPAGKESACLLRGVESKRAYEGHAQKGSDVLQKINLDSKTAKVEVKEVKVQKVEKEGERLRELQKTKEREYSVNRVDIKDYSISRPRKQEFSRTPSYLSKNQETALPLKDSRSRSQLQGVRRVGLAQNDVLRSGKKLNDEISRIQRKIEQFEKEKKRLNIEFTPFSSKNRSSVSLLKGREGQQQSDTRELREGREAREVRLPAFDEKSTEPRNKMSRSKEGVRELLNGYRQQNRQGSFELKIQQVQVKQTLPQQQTKAQAQSQAQNEISTMRIDHPQAEETSQLNIGLKNEVDGGIEERKKRLNNQQIIRTDTVKKLVSLFCEQARLDENLRNLKIWLQSVSDQDKFSKMVSVLAKQGVTISLQQSQRIFTLDESENNPFFSMQGFEGSYALLGEAYVRSEEHWSSCVRRKFSEGGLMNEGFTGSKLDLQRKGFVELQDLVRFLNIESGTFYRNRDLFLIFGRVSGGERSSFEQLLREICA